MAGDWIKIENVTPDKPEVYRIAEALNMDADSALGKLVRIWVWADQQTYDGHAASVTKTLLDRVAGVTGFANAMEKVGWLNAHEGIFTFPNFDRHNGDTAKTRALSTKRKQKQRQNESRQQRDENVTREEKRREEYKTDGECLGKHEDIDTTTTKKDARASFAPPTQQEVATYCSERKNTVDAAEFVDFYTAKNWMIGKNKMKDWKAAVRTWERRRGPPATPKTYEAI
tara:strand:- start:247 stop:930 length:684 start_codon:yes stop_codon:yes gene_type:complete